MDKSRRKFLKDAGIVIASASIVPGIAMAAEKEPFFKISLAEWSLHKTYEKGLLKNIDFPEITKKEFGINIVDYVGTFFKDKVKDNTYLKELNLRANDNGVTNNMIMVGGEGKLGDPNLSLRNQAVENHYKWVDAAKFLGCQSIRVNGYGDGTWDEVGSSLTESLAKLGEYAKTMGIDVIIENHRGYSSNAGWLVNVVKNAGMTNVGILPDLGNFCIEKDKSGNCIDSYNEFKGIRELVEHAKCVSAKSYDFDSNGEETTINYERMMRIIKKRGFRGIIGIEFEYEGSKRLSEIEGIKATKALLEKLGGIV